MKLLASLLASTLLFCTPSAVLADTHVYTKPCWEYSDEHGSMFYAIGDGYQAIHYEYIDDYGKGLDSGLLTDGIGSGWWRSDSAADIRGVDQGVTATFYVMVLADPLNPDSPMTMVIVAVQDPALHAAPRQSSRKH